MNRYRVRFTRSTNEVAYIEIDAKDFDEATELANEEMEVGGPTEWETTDASTPDIDDIQQIGQS